MTLLTPRLSRQIPLLDIPSKQPNIHKKQEHENEEAQPDLPAHARPLRHAQHPVHRASQPIPRTFKPVIHLLRESRTVTNLIAYRKRDLSNDRQQTLVPPKCFQAFLDTHILQHPDFLRHLPNLILILTLQLVDNGIAVLTLPVRRRRPETAVSAQAPTRVPSIRARVGAEPGAGRRLRAQVVILCPESIWRTVVRVEGGEGVLRARPWAGCG